VKISTKNGEGLRAMLLLRREAILPQEMTQVLFEIPTKASGFFHAFYFTSNIFFVSTKLPARKV